jgi:hypothetical protein
MELGAVAVVSTTSFAGRDFPDGVWSFIGAADFPDTAWKMSAAGQAR